MPKEQDETGSVTLHLLDSGQGRPVQTWHFKDCTRVSIGRADDNDISLADDYVSRMHVELLYREGQWLLHSHGRNGTLIDGATVSEVCLTDRAIFQLGSNGPSFQFVTLISSVSSTATIDDIDPRILDFLVIDEERKAEDVQQIAEGELFRQLQQQRCLKRGEDTRESDP